MMSEPHGTDTPVVIDMQVIPVAGQDSMLLNLCGAHGPFFTRNLLILTDSSGRTGVGEVPGGEKTLFMPVRALGAPQTTCTGAPEPVSTMQTRRRSALGCCFASIT